MPAQMYDVLILGGGPAGLTAGLYASRANLRTLLVERMLLGGQVMTTTKVENYPGFPGGIDGPDLMLKMQEHCQEYGLEIRYGDATALQAAEGGYEVVIDGEPVATRTVIVAVGAEPRKLNVLGESAFVGRGVSYCATCDGAFFKNVAVAVVGGGDTAAEEALYLTRFASKVYLIHRRDTLRATKILQDRVLANDKIELVWNTLVERIEGDPSGIKCVELKNTVTGKLNCLPVEGIFIAIGVTPKADFLAETLELDADGYLVTDAECRTRLPGVYAAGDVRKKVLKQIATAIGDGAVAAIMAEKYLMDLA